VETVYGRQMGSWRVIDALSTLAFDYAPRADFFRGELEAVPALHREAGVDVFSVRGSYAGAIGIPQFMPGSYRALPVDFDGNGAIDLRASPADAIGSVANFLAKHGWQRGERVHLPARGRGSERTVVLRGRDRTQDPLVGNETLRRGERAPTCRWKRRWR
jgi:membrane-bound lytic murein transglycosylase B